MNQPTTQIGSGVDSGSNSRIRAIETESDLMRVGGDRNISTKIFAWTNSVVHSVGLLAVLSIVTVLASSNMYLFFVWVVLMALLVKMESIRSYSLTKYYTSVLRSMVVKREAVDSFALGLSIIGSLVFVALSIFTAIELKDRFQHTLVEGYVKNSGEYQAAQANAQSGAEATKVYMELLHSYRSDKSAHNADCDKRFGADFRTKNMECKNSFKEKLPAIAEIKTNSSVSEDQYLSMEAKQSGTLTNAFTLLLGILVAASLLFDYMAIHGIRDEYKAKRAKLTDNTITQLQTREELYQTELETKLEEINNTLQSISSDRIALEASIVDNYHRKDVARLQRLDNHGKKLLTTIQNGAAVVGNDPVETKRAGVLNLRSKKTKEEFVRLLWDSGRVNIGENLVAKSVVATTLYEREDVRKIYKILQENGAVVRVKNNDPYSAKVTMEEALKCLL